MTIHDFEKEKAKLLKDKEIRDAWLEYLSSFPFLSAYYRSFPQYKNQISIVNGKKAGTDINLYKLFVELCYNLLRPGGRCGIITSSGIYTDLGAKQLQELLFSQAIIDSLFGLSNERYIFEGVHHSQKICILVFQKGGTSGEFPAGFRVNPREAIGPENLDHFLHDANEHVQISILLIRRLSPDFLSVMEFREAREVMIAEKMVTFPPLGKEVPGAWKFKLTREFDISKGSMLESKPGPKRALKNNLAFSLYPFFPK